MAYRILLVDDSAAMRSFIRRVIDMSGVDVQDLFEAGDGHQALEVLDREWVDLVLTDINMPGMNGEEFVRRMAESGLAGQIPIVVISTDATSARKGALTGLGVRGYLEKPFVPEALRDEIERVLGAVNHDSY